MEVPQEICSLDKSLQGLGSGPQSGAEPALLESGGRRELFPREALLAPCAGVNSVLPKFVSMEIVSVTLFGNGGLCRSDQVKMGSPRSRVGPDPVTGVLEGQGDSDTWVRHRRQSCGDSGVFPRSLRRAPPH